MGSNVLDIHFGQFDFSNTANENEPKQSRVKTAKEKRLEKRMQQLAVDNFDLIFHFMFIFLFHYLFWVFCLKNKLPELQETKLKRMLKLELFVVLQHQYCIINLKHFTERHLLILFTLRYAAESSKQYLLEKLCRKDKVWNRPLCRNRNK